MEPAKTAIATQTEDETNRASLSPEPSILIYPLSNSRDMPQHRKNLCEVFGEEFLVEATQKALKRVRPYFY